MEHQTEKQTENQIEEKDKNDILKKTTATNLWLRIMVGGFLLYLAYSLGVELKNAKGNDLLIFGGATALFILSGVVIVGWSLYRLIKRDYYDPMLDDEDDEPETESEKESE
ncbi:MAG: hypothetical protein IJ429_03020 [Lachnospiraceae bacterium]|nr:hypothetical protein [Lachnospiraceae bacterium]